MAARTVCREETRKHVEPAVSPRTIGYRLFAAGLRSRVLLARLPPIPRHRQARQHWCRKSVDWREEWRSVVFSDESTICLYASDGRTRVRLDLVSVIIRSAFSHDTQAPPKFSWCGGPSVITRGHSYCFCMVNYSL